MPKVSIIIPTYNRGQYINQAIDSVLKQNYRDYEIIVVDDGSTDDTQARLSVYNGKIKYLFQNNQGVASARNAGVRASQGEYIAFLDSDDIWLSEKLVIQTRILDTDPYIGLTYSAMLIYDEQGHFRGVKPSGNPGANFKELLERGGHYPTSTVMVRRKCLARVGFFDERFNILEDFDLWLRISREYRIFPFAEKPLAIYRWHKENSILDEIKVYQSQVNLYRKILKNFPESSQGVVQRKLLKNQYLLSKLYFTQRNYHQASVLLRNVIRCAPAVGRIFWETNESFSRKTFKLFKPYLFLGACAFKKIFGDSNETIKHK